MGMNIENATDQLGLYVCEVTNEVNGLKSAGFTVDQAIEIVKIAVEDLKAEIFYHYQTDGVVVKAEGNIDGDIGARIYFDDVICTDSKVKIEN